MKELLKSIGITKETVKRALRTFIQAFIACLVVGLSTVDFTAEYSVIKSTLLGLAVSAISAGIAAVMNLQKPEQLGGGQSFDSWVSKYLGKKTDYDGAYGVQCVDLIDCYIAQCLGLKKGFWGNAKNWWTERNSSKWLKDNFDFIIPKYKNGELKRGDIGIRTSGAYGHIFVVSGATANGKIKYYDQNATGNGDKMTLREKPYTSSYITGILRPKNQSNLKSKQSIPTYTNGKTYTLKGVRGIYANHNASVRKKVKELTTDGKKNATSKIRNANAYFKSGTKITVQDSFTDTKQKKVWVKCPSGWITAYNDNTNWLK